MAPRENDIDQPTRAAEAEAVQHQPWRHPEIPITQGVNLNREISNLAAGELARLTNGAPTPDGIFTRWGLTRLQTGGTVWHSAYRLTDPNDSTYTRLWGLDTTLARGIAGVPDLIDSGYSGDPLTFAAVTVPATAEPFVMIADRLRMRKTSRTGDVLPIGLPKPGVPTSAIFDILTTNICAFDASDTSDSSVWAVTAGMDRSSEPVSAGIPTRADVTGLQGQCVEFTTVPGAAVEGYASIFGHTFFTPLDLTKLQGGLYDAFDDDIIHVWIRVDKPGLLEELRIYFVVSEGFDPTIVPGTDATVNQQAYWKAFRAHDFTSSIELEQSSFDTGVTSRARSLVDRYLDDAGDTDTRDDVVNRGSGAQRDLARQPAPQINPGRNVWTQFGAIGIPLRRRDFMKIGDSAPTAKDWANVTGLIIVAQTLTNEVIKLAFDDWFLTGGHQLDSSTPGAQKYDVRVTDYDPRTGTESNPSDEQPETAWLDCLRQAIQVTPVGNPDGNLRQRFYIRGGVEITDDWYYAGENTGNGAAFLIDLTEDELITAGAVDIDHDQAVTTVDSSGNEVLAQPLPVVIGPVLGFMLALGDPYRPGDVYRCKRNEPDHWPADAHVQVCPASEELLNGVLDGGQVLLFSRERAYNLQIDSDGTMIPQPTDCSEGLAGRWGLCTGPGGTYFWSHDGVRRTKGGESEYLTDLLRPLMRGQEANGYKPVDWTASSALRLQMVGDDLWCGFKDTDGVYGAWVLSLMYKTWRYVAFTGINGVCLLAERGDNTPLQALVGGRSGAAYLHGVDAEDDDGSAIACRMTTGALEFGRPREEKIFGDVLVRANLFGATLTCTTYLNSEVVVNSPGETSGPEGHLPYVFEPFGVLPQHARSLSVDLTWNGSSGVRPEIDGIEVSWAPQPPITINRPTQWEPLGPNEGYLKGCWIDSDTDGEPRTILVEVLLGGTRSTAATLSVQSSAGRRQWFSWPAVSADMVRLRPTDDCVPWMLFGQGWIADPAPARIARWDTNWVNLGDVYLTGIDIECDTFGADKNLEVWADGEILETFTVNTTWRSLVHLTLDIRTPLRKHLLRLVASDDNPGLLYSHTWQTDAEPGEQSNWNANYTTWSSQTDKWLKALIIECDTFGEDKILRLDVDGVATEEFLTVNHDGRLIKNYAFPQVKGRVFRLLPTDQWPSRPYNILPVFDEEPYALTRWETQELTHGLGLQVLIRVQIALRSTAAVTLTLTVKGQSDHVVASDDYTIPSTGGEKQLVWVPVLARKGVLFKWVLTSDVEFTLYRPESVAYIQPWGGGAVKPVHPFGDDNLDMVRNMRNATLVAARGGVSGGSAE